MLSKRSKIPPCPGIKLEKSLILNFLLIEEKVRSPNCPMTDKNKVIRAIPKRDKEEETTVIKYVVAIKTPMRVPPIHPSQVLLGDILGVHLCLPINFPVK